MNIVELNAPTVVGCRHLHQRALLAGCALAGLVAVPVHAQAGSGGGAPQSAETVAASANADDAVVGEILVTATRRAESSLSVPISIAALDGDRLFDSHIKDVTDLSQLVPGLTFSQGPATGPTSTDITIRGIGTSAGDATVGIYLDETAVQGTKQEGGGFGETFPSVFDLARIEVLRGPQGTLFGASAMGGAIRYIQTQPDLEKFSGRATAEVGFVKQGGTSYEAGLALGGPVVTDKLGFRASAWHRKEGGYIDTVNPFTGDVVDEDSNRSRTTALRLAVAVAPTETIKITPSFFWQKNHVNNTSYNYFRYLSDEERGDFRYGGLARLPANDRFWIGALTVEADLGFADLISITSYMDRDASAATNTTPSVGAVAPIFGYPDSYGNPLGPSYPVSYDDESHLAFALARKTFSQEVRLSSRDQAGPVSWTIGAYYSDLSQRSDTLFTPLPASVPLFPDDLGTQKLTDQKQLSGFAQVDVRPVDGLTLTAGGRIAQLKVRGSTAYGGVLLYDQSQKNTPFTPKLGIQYELTPRNMVYASYGKGFRPGGINEPLDPTCAPFVGDQSYDPDKLTSYEIGSKNRLFNDRATFTVAGYHTKWKGIQAPVNIQQCNDAYLSNLGSATINGFEAMLSASIASGLRGDVSVSYIDAKYDDNVTTSGRPIVGENYAVSNYSPWTITGSLQYSFMISGYEAFLRAEDTYHSKNNGPFLYQLPGSAGFNPDRGVDPAYNMLNLRAGININNVEVAAFVTNALDASPVLALNNYRRNNNFFVARTLTPRTIGINLNYNF